MRPQLVWSGHGDVESILEVSQGPGAVQSGLSQWASTGAEASLPTGTGQCPDGFLGQVNDSDHVVFGISHVEFVADQHGPLGVIEGRVGISSVLPTDRSAADRFLECSVESGDDNAVVVGVGDEQSAALVIGEHFAGELQRAGFQAMAFEIEADG